MLLAPVRDFYAGLDRCLDRGGSRLALVMLALFAGWWVYVPVHELLHAAGCVLAGGEVTRLEIDTLYGGALLARVFPFVAAGSEYAGQLTGFDTGGSDLVYLATDLLPFALTVFPGVWAVRRFGRSGASVGFGFFLPFALAPFLSITGDAYEIGSILVTNVPPWSAPEALALLRDDDALERFGALRTATDAPWAGWALASLLGLAWAYATYGLGALVARRLGARRAA